MDHVFILVLVVVIGDITWRNIGVYSDDNIDEAGRRLCSLGADIQSRSTPGDRL